jgi:predicted signal transduction protein with EAL and GGDEF domain
VSIGVAVFPADARDGEVLKHHADIALYRAKQTGRGNVCFFAPFMDREVRARRQMEHDLRLAVQRHQMSIAYQPMVASDTGGVVGYEALLRWHHPDLGDVPPSEFIPVAEESGSIVQLGEWVLATACRDAASWPEPLTLAVNMSPVQFQLPSLARTVENCLRQAGLPPHRLELEVTEVALMRNSADVLAIFRQLKTLGVSIVMDDFGTGYSSLNSLQSFPFDKIKIDRSFIGALESDEAARSIVRAIVGLGRSLNLSVVAEGIETEAQWRLVVEEGCPGAQGFLFGSPNSVGSALQASTGTVGKT